MQEYRLVTCQTDGEDHETLRRTVIDTELTADLYPMLVNAMLVAILGDGDDVSVRKRNAGDCRTRDTDWQSTTTAVWRV
jgi:hypothetical protein